MAISEKAKSAYKRYKTFKKARDYYSIAKKILDEDARPEGLFKLGLKGLLALGEKAIGASLTSHPYYTFHKAHLEALGNALTAVQTHENAMKALHTAISAADSAEALAGQIANLTNRKNALKLAYAFMLAGGLQLRTDKSAEGAAQLRASGHTAASLDAAMEDKVYQWRAEICDLYFDAADLLIMIEIEYRAADAAYKRYTTKVDKLQRSTKPMDRIAGHSAENKRMWEWYDREVGRSKAGSGQAVENPSKWAERQRDKVKAVADTLATICDEAMSGTVYNSTLMMTKIGSL